jgi:hypothetical protein
MTIKNTDGSIYQLRLRTNQLLKNQDTTSDNHTVHNFRVEEVTVRYKRKKLAPVGAVIGTPDLPPLVKEQIALPEPEPILDPVAPMPEVDEDDYPTDEESTTADTISCWCLPGEHRKVVDNLYGETRGSIAWGDKFLFEATILDMSEINFQLWTQVKINPPSIIFVRPHKRWWRVTNTEQYNDGYIMTCMPSEHRPRFD